MGKQQQIKVPKYLKLNKGTMWMDIDGPDSSGVKLYNTTVKFVGRGVEDDSKIPLDKHKNENSGQDGYGFVDLEEDKSYFCTTDIPKEKMKGILNAMKSKILVPYNPKKKQEPKEPKKFKKNFKINKDGDVVFSGENKTIYNKLMSLKFDKLKEFIEDCDSSYIDSLMDMYDYELKGYNPLNRPRQEVIEVLRKKLNSFGPSMSPLRVNDLDEKEDK